MPDLTKEQVRADLVAMGNQATVDKLPKAETDPVVLDPADGLERITKMRLATAISPGAVASNLTTALTPTGDSQYVSAVTKAAADTLAANGEDYLASGTVPAFVANAASIAPGTDKASYYPIEAARTLPAGAALTVATTGSPPVGNLQVACKARSLGFVMTVVNGGPAGGNLGSGFAASLTRACIMHLWFDGTNYIFNGYDFIL